MRLARSFSLVLVVALAAGSACAAREGKGAQEPSDEAIDEYLRLSKPAREHMMKVNEHVRAKEWDEALRELERMKERKYLDDHERAVMWQMFGVLYFERGDFEESAAAGEKALELGGLSDRARLRTLNILGQLYVMMERFDRASELLSEWIAGTQDPKPEDHYLVASAYSQQKKFAEALPHAKAAVDGMTETKQPWLELLLSLHFELKQEREVLAMLERLIAEYPKDKRYRLQLVETHRALDEHTEALAAMEQAYGDGLLDEERDLVNLAALYIEREQPLKGAELLDVHMGQGRVARTPEHLQMMARGWALAGDEAKAKAAMKQVEALGGAK